MRLLFIQNVAPNDPEAFGGQRIHHELTRAMAARGHDARAVFLTPDGTLPPLPYPAWGLRATGRLRLDARAVGAAMAGIFANWTPDVVYGGAAESACALAWAKSHCRTAATSHHYDPPLLTELPSILRPIARIQEWRRLQRFRMEREMLSGADLVLATSAFGATALRERGYLGPNPPPSLLYNGVDDLWFDAGSRSDEHEGAKDPGGFLFIGRMDTQKGIDVLLEALSLRSGNWPLTLVGGGWMEGRYRKRAAALGVDGAATFVGLLAHDDVRRNMRSFDGFVLPSRAENCPLVLLESMAAGLPVVATHVGGIPELVTDEESALLVPPDDPQALAHALDRVEVDAQLRAHLRLAGRKVAERQRWSAVAERLEKHLEGIVQKA